MKVRGHRNPIDQMKLNHREMRESINFHKRPSHRDRTSGLCELSGRFEVLRCALLLDGSLPQMEGSNLERALRHEPDETLSIRWEGWASSFISERSHKHTSCLDLY